MATETLARYAGDIIAGDILASENPGTRAEVAEDCSAATIIWIEPLRFHLEHAPQDMGHLLAIKATPEGNDVAFTDEARQEFTTYMSEFLASDKWNIDNADILPAPEEEWDNEACVALAYHFDTPNGPETTMEEFSNRAWPFIAAMTNVTDPGTFNNPYVMSALTERIIAKQEG